MHKRAYDYVFNAEKVGGEGVRIVELGSYDVNGSVRDIFTGYDYTGIDIRPGKGVDVVADAAEWGEDASYSVVISTETLEHAENAEAIVANAYRILEPGGVFIMTGAGPKREPHGNDGGDVGNEFYRNIEPEELSEWLEAAGFSDFDIDVTSDGEDIQMTARKAEAKSKK